MNATAHKVFTNTIGQVTLRSFEIVTGILTLGLITRHLGQLGFGYYTTITAILQLCAIVIDLGLYLTLLRELAAHPRERYGSIFNNIFSLRIVSSIAFLSIASGGIFLTTYPLPVKLGVAMLAWGTLCSTLISTMTAPFQQELKTTKVAMVNLVNKILLLGAVIFIVSANLGLQALLLATSLAATIAVVLLMSLLKKLPTPIHARMAFDLSYWAVVLKKTWPLALTIALNLIYFKADTIILSLVRSPEEVGIYGASYRVLEIIAAFPHMFMGLVMPILTAAWIARDFERIHRVWQRTFTLFALITAPLVAGTLVVGRPLMRLIAGDDFEISGSILKVLMVATAVIFFGTLYTYLVLIIDRQRAIIKYFAATTIIALIGYFIFIPRYSYWGAAWMTVASELFIVIGAWLVARKEISLTIPFRILIRIIIASGIMALFAWKLSLFMPVIPVIVISIVLYGAIVLALRIISLQDIKKLIAP